MTSAAYRLSKLQVK